jgi:deazaflavin-dependent oxidoreductase (nitroreductase family)
MSDGDERNRRVIEEFRAAGGSVGGAFAATPLLLLHHTGARSGRERVNPLAYQRLGEAVAVFASKGGAPRHPDWFHNLVANPKASIEIGADHYDVVARVAEGEERERIWAAQKEGFPGFADYERRAGKRRIPVVVLERA